MAAIHAVGVFIAVPVSAFAFVAENPLIPATTAQLVIISFHGKSSCFAASEVALAGGAGGCGGTGAGKHGENG